jgi:hypothetical protein
MNEVVDRWKKGRVLDLWSIPHFLLGILCAFIPFYSHLTFEYVFVSMVVLAFLWEIGEYIAGIKETIWNNIADVLLPIISFLIIEKVLVTTTLLQEQRTVAFVGVITLYFFTNISGWLAYRRRQRDFTH